MGAFSKIVLTSALAAFACERAPAAPTPGNAGKPPTDTPPAETPPANPPPAETPPANPPPAETAPADTPPTETPSAAKTTCTPHFTPYQPGAQHCSANHTVCREGPNGKECHGGAILIPCGESGERCGKTFHCDCGDAGKSAK